MTVERSKKDAMEILAGYEFRQRKALAVAVVRSPNNERKNAALRRSHDAGETLWSMRVSINHSK
jgi:hypothetical protein